MWKTQRLLKKLIIKKKILILLVVADEAPENGNKKFSLTPVADEGKNSALDTIKMILLLGSLLMEIQRMLREIIDMQSQAIFFC